jgi:hypothetical protein
LKNAAENLTLLRVLRLRLEKANELATAVNFEEQLKLFVVQAEMM